MTSLNPLHRIGRQVAEAFMLHRRLPVPTRAPRVIELLTEVGFADAAGTGSMLSRTSFRAASGSA